MNRTLQKDDMVTVMECDDELVEELGLIAGDNVTDEEDDDKYVTEISVETEAQVNQQELKLNLKGEKNLTESTRTHKLIIIDSLHYGLATNIRKLTTT
ncbi:hypothetical protein INT47_006301 [Mucor saturninus]|uniref:Uncharacterized protein n=1 Tax=Mucor saturninus TaxID=64648 RepID=A0A8H7RJ25_9FUNG|nr:hypothetical protein INT47_006301 [Mucor saturninus]